MSWVYVIAQMILFKGALRASALIHEKLISTILNTTLRLVPCLVSWLCAPSLILKCDRWLDKTPVARIITRCTLDVSASESELHRRLGRMTPAADKHCIVDSVIPDVFSSVFEVSVVLTVRFFAILIFTPRVGLIGIAIAVAGTPFTMSQAHRMRRLNSFRRSYFGKYLYEGTTIGQAGDEQGESAGGGTFRRGCRRHQ